MADQIASAQANLESQLADLERLGLAEGDPALMSELRNQLAVLRALGQFLDTAHGPALYQLRAEIATSSAAALSLSRRAQGSIASVEGRQAAQQAEYAAATAEIDGGVVAARQADRDNNALAHVIAKRVGIDLGEYDQERDRLNRQRNDAVAQGDKVGERQADVLLAQNTYDAMAASADKITDPQERQRYLQQMQQQQQNIDTLRHALEQQLELEAGKIAREQGLSPKETAAFVAQYKATGLAKSDHDRQDLKGAGQAATVAFPNADAAGLASAQTSFQAAANTSTFSLTAEAPPIALSDAPDAHTKIEVPPVAKRAIPSDHGLA